jgi:hypothetical protein
VEGVLPTPDWEVSPRSPVSNMCSSQSSMPASTPQLRAGSPADWPDRLTRSEHSDILEVGGPAACIAPAVERYSMRPADLTEKPRQHAWIPVSIPGLVLPCPRQRPPSRSQHGRSLPRTCAALPASSRIQVVKRGLEFRQQEHRVVKRSWPQPLRGTAPPAGAEGADVWAAQNGGASLTSPPSALIRARRVFGQYAVG